MINYNVIIRRKFKFFSRFFISTHKLSIFPFEVSKPNQAIQKKITHTILIILFSIYIKHGIQILSLNFIYICIYLNKVRTDDEEI